MIPISPFHFVTQDHQTLSHAQLAEQACEAGVDWVQLRVKERPLGEWLQVAYEVKAVCDRYGAVLIINDNVRVAKEVQAHGVHLGPFDMPPHEARQILGEDSLIGGSANTVAEVRALVDRTVDYVGVGPFRMTTTKTNLRPLLGEEGFKKIVEQVKQQQIEIPLVAIGGIEEECMPQLFQCGIHGVAVSAAIAAHANPCRAAQTMLQTVRRYVA